MLEASGMMIKRFLVFSLTPEKRLISKFHMAYCATNRQIRRNHLDYTSSGFHRFPIKCNAKTLYRNKHAILQREPLHIVFWIEINNDLMMSKPILQNGLNVLWILQNDKLSQITVRSSHFVSINIHY